MNNYRIFNGDCLYIMNKLIENNIKVDMILTDPPYGTTKFKWDKIIDFDLMWEKLDKLCNDNTPILLFGKQPFFSKLILSNEKMYKQELIWEKSRNSNSMQLKRQFGNIHENIAVFYKKQPTYNDLKFKVDEKYIDKRKSINDSIYKNGHYSGKMTRKKDDGWRHPQTILPFNSVWEKNMHPTQKPVELLEDLIKTYTNENDIVLDFTMGSGSTGVACMNTNRNFIGIELDKEYFNIAKNRIAKSAIKGE